MGATAQLNGAAADIDDAHGVAILFREQRHSALLFGIVLRHFGNVDRQGGEDHVIDQCFNPGKLLGGDGGKMRKVEAAEVAVHQLACLMHMRAQHLAQRKL
ncbi:hypothetical protein SDC9_184283 [bioreactor metagenome]|uniref:Uncharacterized protein n=1 Tax=bioreactor metagenome TaxID=1076179 RepID=A0A645HEH6_9ZZZZ